MKRIVAFTSIFVVTFLMVVGAVVFTADNTEAAGRKCKYFLPCHPDDIYCTSNPCDGTCYPATPGGIFYCEGDWITEYCSKDYYYPVPCSNFL